MPIRRFETFPVGLPFREPYVTSTGTLERREMILLRIEDDDGVVGWGDAVPLSLRGGASLATVESDLNRVCREALVGAELGGEANAGATLDPLLDRCEAAGVEPPALAALNAAFLDLLGNVRGEPAWRLLGAPSARPVTCNGTLGSGEAASVADGARELAGAGFSTIKVKVGTGADRERMLAVREATGPEVGLRIDANGAWTVERARIEVTAIDGEVGLELVEQPCSSLDDLAAVRSVLDVPVVADEGVTSVADAERAEELEACDAATLKLAKVGGPRAALRIGARVPAYLSSALDSPLGIAAAAHTAQALKPAGEDGFVAGLAHGLATSSLFADNVADDAGLTGPVITLSSGPGLGIEIDETAVERLRIR